MSYLSRGFVEGVILMGYEILPSPHPDISILRIANDLTNEDMTTDEQLGLNQGRPRWILLDAADMNVGLPDDFLTGVRKSFFVNPNLVHLSIYIKSSILRSVALMVAKITRRQDKLTLHSTYDEALAYLMKLVEQNRTSKV
jgi:hypothetical protein